MRKRPAAANDDAATFEAVAVHGGSPVTAQGKDRQCAVLRPPCQGNGNFLFGSEPARGWPRCSS